MLPTLWQRAGKKRTHRRVCMIFTLFGVLLAVAGICCVIVGAYTLDGDFALLGGSLLVFGGTVFFMANHFPGLA